MGWTNGIEMHCIEIDWVGLNRRILDWIGLTCLDMNGIVFNSI